MSDDILLDPIFLVPFLNGLGLAVLLPLVGAYARLRGELLASLGVTQMAAAGIGLGSVIGVGVTPGALLAAGLAAGLKSLAGRRGGNDTYAAMLLAGWAGGLLLAANSPRGDDLVRALLQGQIYFTGWPHLRGILVVGLVTAALLPWLSPRLLRGCFFPETDGPGRTGMARHDMVFDLLMAFTLALSALVVGVMGAFALVILPPWVAFRFAGSWRTTLTVAALLGMSVYLVAFAAAILLDQPFGPTLVLMLLIVSSGRLIGRI